MNLYLEYWLTFFVVFPILEWGFHYALHRFNNKIHNNPFTFKFQQENVYVEGFRHHTGTAIVH